MNRSEALYKKRNYSGIEGGYVDPPDNGSLIIGGQASVVKYLC